MYLVDWRTDRENRTQLAELRQMSEAHLDLEHVIFISRTFDKYMRMFDLKVEDLTARKILDCPAGACPFTAHGSKFGVA